MKKSQKSKATTKGRNNAMAVLKANLKIRISNYIIDVPCSIGLNELEIAALQYLRDNHRFNTVRTDDRPVKDVAAALFGGNIG